MDDKVGTSQVCMDHTRNLQSVDSKSLLSRQKTETQQSRLHGTFLEKATDDFSMGKKDDSRERCFSLFMEEMALRKQASGDLWIER
jgi:hypothetical protein